MFLADAADTAGEPVRIPWAAGLTVSAALAFTLFVGFLPGWLVSLTRDAVPQLGIGR